MDRRGMREAHILHLTMRAEAATIRRRRRLRAQHPATTETLIRHRTRLARAHIHTIRDMPLRRGRPSILTTRSAYPHNPLPCRVHRTNQQDTGPESPGLPISPAREK